MLGVRLRPITRPGRTAGTPSLRAAHGLATSAPGSLDSSHEPGETFASLLASFTPERPAASSLAGALSALLGPAAAKVRSDSFSIRIDGSAPAAAAAGSIGKSIADAIEQLRDLDPAALAPAIDAAAIRGLKFAECLPESLAQAVLRARQSDARAISVLLGRRP